MSLVPVIPDTAPFTAEQRAWLNGYLAGLFSRGPVDAHVAARAQPGASAAAQLTPLTILFGSQTGTAEALARRAAKEAGKRGFAAMPVDMAQMDAARLASERNVLVITSTFGDGEPPDNAKALHAALASARTDTGPRLPAVRFAVCGLGDSNYARFCQCARDFDGVLEKLGATRVIPRTDCDVDYEAAFSAWLHAALHALATTNAAGSVPPIPDIPVVASTASVKPATEGYSRSKPFRARVLASRCLNQPGSAKQVHHVEFALDDSGLAYEAGDALGVMPVNCPEIVDEVLSALSSDGEEGVPSPEGTTVPLRQALSELYDLGKPTSDTLALFGGGGGGGVALAVHDVPDLLRARMDVTLAPEVFVKTLRRLQPRLYSISSSPKAHAGQVHLTVGAVRYELGGRDRKGVCSTFLADRVVPGVSRIGIHVHSNRAFRLPASGDTRVIMIGPGTGVAPFRAFLHERKAVGARAATWLFFGDQREATDFLYREELLAMKAEGTLAKLDLAWSRDQKEKIYVQSRMLEHAAELYDWLESGAHLYVCGDASRMARDVDTALHWVIERASGRSREHAAEYVRALTASKRYCRDVY